MEQPRSHTSDFIVKPLGEHKESVIVLHGRGDKGMQFGSSLMVMKMPNGQTFREALPNAKFLFPTAPLTMSWDMHEWFPISSLIDPSINQEEQVEGLVKSTELVHELIRQEINLVGAQNVVVGGLSQGCATTLISLALWDGPPLRAVFGMSGWLPMYKNLQRSLNNDDGESTKLGRKAVQDLRAALGLRSQDADAIFTTPILICHGSIDEKVACHLGEEIVLCLRQMGCSVEWRQYPELAHWYCGAELHDVASFIKSKQL